MRTIKIDISYTYTVEIDVTDEEYAKELNNDFAAALEVAETEIEDTAKKLMDEGWEWCSTDGYVEGPGKDEYKELFNY